MRRPALFLAALTLTMAALLATVRWSPALADTTSVQTPISDTFISQQAPTTNYCNDALLRAREQTSKAKRIYVSYNLAGLIPAGATVTDATLSLYSAAVGYTGVTVYPVSQASGCSLTWNTAVAYDSAHPYGSKVATDAGWNDIPLTANLGLLDLTGTTTFLVKATAATTKNNVADLQFHSRDNASGNKPKLTISYTPPATTTTTTEPMPTTTVTMGAGPAPNRYGAIPNLGDPTVADWDAIDAAGAQWMRMDADWWRIEGTKGVYDWSRPDSIMASANARGIKMLWMMGYTPPWARAAGTDDKYPPTNSADYADFLTAFANRYYSQGATTYELWNEPNISTFWHPAPDVAQYVSLLTAGYNALKAVNTNIKVVTAGMAPAGDTAPQINGRTFLSGIYSNGGGGKFDAVGWHPYCWANPPIHAGDFAEWSNWSQMADTSPSARSIMVANGDTAKPIWATEYGGPTGGGSQAWTEAFQAADVTTAYGLWKSYSWTTASWGNAPLMWYHWRDRNTSDTVDYEQHFGLEHTDGTDKPAYANWVAEAAKP